MSRVLLVNSNRFKRPWPVIPFGLCCVAAACEDAGHETRVLDLCFSRDCPKDIHEAVEAFAPDVIGIGVRNIDNGVGRSTSFLLGDVKQDVIRPVKEVFTGPIVIGGASVGISPREMLDFFDLEYAARGDGEGVMVELLDRHESAAPWQNVPGLVIRRGGQVVQDQPPHRIADLDGLPWPRAHKYIDVAAYRRFNSPLQVQTKRGCALKCVYCVYNQVEGHQYRLRNPMLVADEIEALVRETGINHIEFTDSTFNLPLDHAKAVIRAVIQKKLDLQLRTMGLNPGGVDEELVDLMQQAGFVDVDLGAESGCDVTLKGLGKNYTKQAVLNAGKLLQQRHISTTWFLLLGGPGETRVTVEETIDTITRAAGSNDLICVSIGVRAYNGAPITEQLRERDPNASQDNFLRPVDYQPDGISLDEIKYLVQRARFDWPNILITPEDENVSDKGQIRGIQLLRLLRSKQPLWKLYIFSRRMEIWSGVACLKRWLWERKQNPAWRAPK